MRDGNPVVFGRTGTYLFVNSDCRCTTTRRRLELLVERPPLGWYKLAK